MVSKHFCGLFPVSSHIDIRVFSPKLHVGLVKAGNGKAAVVILNGDSLHQLPVAAPEAARKMFFATCEKVSALLA